MPKNSKNFQFLKKFFFARNNLKCLKIFSQHHLCSPRQISDQYLSKKKLFILQEICYPGYAKKSKKFFSLETTLNALKFVRNFRPVSRKKVVSHFSRNLWPPDMQKKSKNFQFLKKIFFARNNLKCLKICSQHHLCSPRQISGRYLSKKKLVIFQEICDPGYAKKVKKFSIFKKKMFRSKRPKTP